VHIFRFAEAKVRLSQPGTTFFLAGLSELTKASASQAQQDLGRSIESAILQRLQARTAAFAAPPAATTTENNGNAGPPVFSPRVVAIVPFYASPPAQAPLACRGDSEAKAAAATATATATVAAPALSAKARRTCDTGRSHGALRIAYLNATLHSLRRPPSRGGLGAAVQVAHDLKRYSCNI
jgi:hypothetical protein